MAFLDKLTDAAAAIGDKANEAVESTKIKTKINSEKKSIESQLAALGRIYYERARAGETLEPEAMQAVEEIRAHEAAVEALEEQLRDLG